MAVVSEVNAVLLVQGRGEINPVMFVRNLS
jgi:hypothetical protein